MFRMAFAWLSKDPRYGSSALDRAVDAGKEQTALLLLDLGADPVSGRGVDYLLARAGPEVRARLPLREHTAPKDASEAEVQKLRVQLTKSSERMLLKQMEDMRPLQREVFI